MTRENSTQASWLLALVCALAAWLSISNAPAATETSEPVLHGVSALPGGRALPNSERPPGSEPDDGGPSSVIFPEQHITLRFNHQKHVRDLHMPCTGCHERAKISASSGDRLMPAAARCDACHGSDHGDLAHVTADASELISQCGYCHLGYRPSDGNRVERMSVPIANLKFDHRAHVSRQIACAKCHGALENLELAGRDQLPRMQGCLSCHGGTFTLADHRVEHPSAECPTCHLTEGPRLKTRFGLAELLPPRWLKDSSHGPDWIARHRSIAGDDSQFCGNCHSEKYCADCHDGRVRPRRVHPNDYLSLHPEGARMNSPRCTSCHQEQSFCLPCHQRVGISQSGPYGNFADRGRFHPPAAIWTNAPRSARHHSWEAERNLNACVSCHVERDCVACHAARSVGGQGGGLSAGGRGLDPHPLGFRNQCAHALRQNARPCLVCHDPADPNLRECR